MRRQQGVTLIELMVVVLLLGLLALASSSLTSHWGYEAKVTETLGLMEQAVGQARSAALRNPAAIRGDNPASMLCSDGSRVRLVLPTVAVNNLSCSGTAPAEPWSGTLPGGIAVKESNSAWACTCFSSKGLPFRSGSVCGSCSATLDFEISSTGNSGDPANVSLH